MFLLPATAAALDPVFTATFSNDAIRGYDPVAYFDAGTAVEGNDKYSHEWKGATWLFSSAKNRDAFIANPEKFAPQYGGYCACAAAKGYIADVDPAVWKIVEGKLYLNYNRAVQKKWLKDIPGYIEKADKNWPGILKK